MQTILGKITDTNVDKRISDLEIQVSLLQELSKMLENKITELEQRINDKESEV